MTPANDNGPIRADEFTDLAARRTGWHQPRLQGAISISPTVGLNFRPHNRARHPADFEVIFSPVTLLGNLRRRVRKCPYRYGNEPTEGLKPPPQHIRSACRGRRNEEPARNSTLVASLDAPRVRAGLGEHFAVLEASLDEPDSPTDRCGERRGRRQGRGAQNCARSGQCFGR